MSITSLEGSSSGQFNIRDEGQVIIPSSSSDSTFVPSASSSEGASLSGRHITPLVIPTEDEVYNCFIRALPGERSRRLEIEILDRILNEVKNLDDLIKFFDNYYRNEERPGTYFVKEHHPILVPLFDAFADRVVERIEMRKTEDPDVIHYFIQETVKELKKGMKGFPPMPKYPFAPHSGELTLREKIQLEGYSKEISKWNKEVNEAIIKIAVDEMLQENWKEEIEEYAEENEADILIDFECSDALDDIIDQIAEESR